MKKTAILFSFIALSFLGKSQNGLEQVWVEKFYVSNVADTAQNSTGGTLPVGSVTYRVWVDMKAGYKFTLAYGNSAHPLDITTTTSFFNNQDRGATTPNGITTAQMKKNTVMLGSWFSVGAAASGQIAVPKPNDTNGSIGNTDGILKNNDPSAGIPISSEDGMISGTPQAVTFIGPDPTGGVFDAVSQFGHIDSTSNGGWSSLNGSVGADTTNNVLILQLTTDGRLTFHLNVQVESPAGNAERYVYSNPNPDPNPNNHENLGTGLIFDSGLITNTSEYQHPRMAAIDVYPNPAKDEMLLVITSIGKSNSNFYNIYDVTGKLVLQKELGLITDNRTERIDISSLPRGVYFVTCTIDGVNATTRKLVKM
jgi:hypothetical protein